MLGGNPGSVSNPDAPATNLLYAGEQFDIDAQQYYLRARYYDPLNGRFNQMDPFAGNNQDPQSLHKYLYCYANPVNNVDPSGQFSFTEMVTVSAIIGMLSAGVAGMVTAVRGGTVRQVFNAQVEWLYKGFFTAAAIYGAFWITHSLLVFLFGTSAGMGGLEVARQYGIRDYDSLREALTGTGYFAHHIIEQRFAPLLGLKVGEMASVAVTGPEHQMFTNAWRTNILYITGTATATKELIWEKAQIIYAEYPALLEAAKAMLGM